MMTNRISATINTMRRTTLTSFFFSFMRSNMISFFDCFSTGSPPSFSLLQKLDFSCSTSLSIQEKRTKEKDGISNQFRPPFLKLFVFFFFVKEGIQHFFDHVPFSISFNWAKFSAAYSFVRVWVFSEGGCMNFDFAFFIFFSAYREIQNV